MSSVCTDQHLPKHFISHKKLFFKDLDIPPRKQQLLSKKLRVDTHQDMHSLDYLYVGDNLEKDVMADQEDDEEELDPYGSDHFRMYEFKVRRCTRNRSHDWTDCPFAHPGEKARRRDPRRYRYSGAVCAEFRRGSCSRGDSCEFAHGVFECWLHPSRYRTEACKDGKNCKRKVCFFAHTPNQLRAPSESACSARMCHSESSCCRNSSGKDPNGCMVCHSVSSPTSTLFSLSHLSPPLSPQVSPPVSPAKQRGYGGLSARYGERLLHRAEVLGYQEVVKELMSSLEGMSLSESKRWGGGIVSPWFGMREEEIWGQESQSDPDIGWVNDLLM